MMRGLQRNPIKGWLALGSIVALAIGLLAIDLGELGLDSLGQLSSMMTIPDWNLASHLIDNDSTNDKAAHLSTHKLIERAGFDYENHYAVADDGYVTQLIRIINPLADRSKLKVPPVMISHGQTASSKNFVMQSNKQHFPMPYPAESKSPMDDELETPNESEGLANKLGKGLLNVLAHEPEDDRLEYSSNRSLALMLANNGFDVWLTSTRGVDQNNRGFSKQALSRLQSSLRLRSKNMTRGEERLLLSRVRKSYWSFTLDDQIAHELPSQIAVVLNVTGASKITLFGYSNTAATTFAMLSVRPDIARYVDTYLAAAPVIYYNKLSGWFKWFMEEFMQLIPKRFDAELFLSDNVANFMRRVSMRICKPYAIRYTVCKFMLNLLFGHSSQLRTHLELPFFGQMLRPTSWKCLAQHLQIVKSHRLEKFDYGIPLNELYYGSSRPPEYKLEDVDPSVNVVLVSGERDCWANQATVDEVRAKLPRRPDLDLVIEDYNHLDLFAAADVDKRVNLPILEWLNQRHRNLSRQWEASDLQVDAGSQSSD